MKRFALLALVLTGLALRLYTATLGETYDMHIWRENAALYNRAATYPDYDYIVFDRETRTNGPLQVPQSTGYNAVLDRHEWNNYARPWWDLLGAIARVYPPESREFRLAVSAVISVVDVLNGALLYNLIGLGAAALYLLCPITVLVAGYGGQFDGMVLFGALAAVYAMRNERPLVAAVFLAFSIMLKPVFIALPLWWVVTAWILNDRKLNAFLCASWCGIFCLWVLLPNIERLPDIYTSIAGGSRGWNMLATWRLLPLALRDGSPYSLTIIGMLFGACYAPRDYVRSLGWYIVVFTLTIPSWHPQHAVYIVGALCILGGWELWLACAMLSIYFMGDNNYFSLPWGRLWIPQSPADSLDECLGNCDRRWVWSAVVVLLAVRLTNWRRA